MAKSGDGNGETLAVEAGLRQPSAAPLSSDRPVLDSRALPGTYWPVLGGRSVASRWRWRALAEDGEVAVVAERWRPEEEQWWPDEEGDASWVEEEQPEVERW